MILLIGHYRDRSVSRRGELLASLARNLSNRAIDEVHVFLEDDIDPDTKEFGDRKVRIRRVGRRSTFYDFFDYANRELPGRRVIVANSDIYFDDTLARLDRYDLNGKLLCLSRWDVQSDGSTRFFEQPWSQDAWIFQAPIPTFRCDWYLGLPGCENRLAYEAERSGLELLNPGRSVRANHLHVSAVRNYTERQRLPGHGRGIEATYLGTPWLWPIVTCMGRLADVREHFGSVMAQPRSRCVFVDYACPDGSAAWIREHHSNAVVVQVRGRHAFNAAEARNAGAAATDPDAVLCFLDADVTPSPDFAESALSKCEPGSFVVPDQLGPGLDSALVCWRSDFDRVGGYDENYLVGDPASEDLRIALRRAGLVEHTFPAELLARRALAPDKRASFAPLPERALADEVDASYRRVKNVIAAEAGDGVSRAALRESQRAILHRRLSAGGFVPAAPVAAVWFHESMGYTVGRLQAGVSSHNNEARPFDSIPAPLDGLAFTQVVASRVSPVRVEFRDTGKLYVLVGTDWHGYHASTAFLRQHGYREPIPHVSTRRGTGFEVWSLVGVAGDTLELPTQVMLVARDLVHS